VDQYLKGRSLFVVIISSAMHIGTMAGSILGAEMYVAGGWKLVGPLSGLFNIIPLLFLPFVSKIPGLTADKALEKVLKTEGSGGRSTVIVEKKRLSKMQQMVYYLPDMAVFTNNLAFNVLVFVLPARMVQFNSLSLSSAVLFLNLLNLFSFLSSLLLGWVATKKVDVFLIMILGNIVFYVGCVSAFGSTTQFLNYPLAFEVGSVLIGLGDAAIVNLCIRSKFALYERWGLEDPELGVRSTTVFNVVLCLSGVVGTVLSGLTTTRASEVPTLGVSVAACFVLSVGLVFCKLV